jgi:putative addiction module component (TIGR02574 family)
MTKAAVSKSMRRLPLTARIELLEELWHTIAADQALIPITNAQKAEIDECLAEIERHPGEGMSLPEFRRFLKSAVFQLKGLPKHKRAG